MSNGLLIDVLSNTEEYHKACIGLAKKGRTKDFKRQVPGFVKLSKKRVDRRLLKKAISHAEETDWERVSRHYKEVLRDMMTDGSVCSL
jgi:hypothetical protein